MEHASVQSSQTQMQTANTPLIRMENIAKRFGVVTALDGVDFQMNSEKLLRSWGITVQVNQHLLRF